MSQAKLRKILIVGGGSAGWMTAALFANMFQGLYDIELIESEAIGTVGVGEATIPSIKKFNELLDLDEDEFMRMTMGSFKLGIQFRDWWKQGHEYFHSFGPLGQDWEWLRCHQYWLKAHLQGRAPDFSELSVNSMASRDNKFMRPRRDMADSPLSHIAYAFHFDASLYARFLRRYSEQRGVLRTEGMVADVTLRPEDGFIDSVTTTDGRRIEADLFIDCTGFRGLLIEQALKTGYEDWTRWLPCDRAMAMPCERTDPITPYTRSTARESGWQWRIPLQHRTGNGMVYSSRFADDAWAETTLRANLDGAPMGEPNLIRFTTGKRRQTWNKNCVAMGLASGFLEPLESTSLHLIQSAAIRLVRLFPDHGFDPAVIAEFNRQTDFEYERCRDFIILHYKATTRDDSELWRHCRDMDVPDTLQRKIDLFRSSGRVFREDEELFNEESWIQVFLGQGVVPTAPDPMVELKSDAQIAQFLGNIALTIRKCVDVMPVHDDYLSRVCKAAA